MHETPEPEFREQPIPETNEQPGPEFQERPNPEFRQQKIFLPQKRRDPVFYIALALAAFCIIGAFSATAFVAGFVTSSVISKDRAANPFEMKRTMIIKSEGWASKPQEWISEPQRGQIIAKVAITQNGDSFQFSPQEVKIPAGNGIAWINQTNQGQILITENGSASKIVPSQVTVMFFKEDGKRVVLHLAADPAATIVIFVGPRN